jgi:carbon storage regulator CsrA
MLTLTREAGSAIRIGEKVIVRVLEVKRNRIRLGLMRQRK